VLAAVVCTLAGVLAGSLLPRLAYRLSVPCGAPPRSACGRCARPFPRGLAGWVRPGSHCSGCAGRLGLVAVATTCAAAVAGLVAGGAVATYRAGSRTEAGLLLAVLMVVALTGVLLAAVDLAVLRLPDLVVLPTGVVVAALLGIAALGTGDPAPAARGLAGATALGGAYGLLGLLPGSPLGFGDVKLAAVLGAPLGWLGWPAVLLGGVLPVALGGLAALALLATGQIRRDTPVPFGPALVAGFLLSVVLCSGGSGWLVE
jgi:leader peptidase (prepilin peptidase) / N-methyltransferase